MTRILATLMVCLTALAFLPAQEKSTTDAQMTAIQRTALDYLEGWYGGDAGKMERALHPALVKRGLLLFQKTGKMILNPINAEALIEAARAGVGRLPEDQWMIDVKVLDVYGDIALVKASSAKFMDYLQLARQDGRWRIVNVLWTPSPPPTSVAP